MNSILKKLKINIIEIAPVDPLLKSMLGNNKKDIIEGSILGLALGDSQGVPYERRANGWPGEWEYSLTRRPKQNSRFQGTKYMGIGQISDDTEMMIILARHLSKGKYNSRVIFEDYSSWADTCPFLGKNTRDLFKLKVKYKYAKYERVFAEKFKLDANKPWENKSEEGESAQSNGSLMRCLPIAFISNEKEFNRVLESDVWMTNPSTVVLEAERIYLMTIRDIIAGIDSKDLFDLAEKRSSILRDIFSDIRNKKIRDVTGKNKGWVLHAFYLVYYCLYNKLNEDYQSIMKYIIIDNYGGDTDTNAAIVGAVFGALNGKNMRKNLNVKFILDPSEETDFPRDEIYQLKDLDSLVNNLSNRCSGC